MAKSYRIKPLPGMKECIDNMREVINKRGKAKPKVKENKKPGY